MKLFSRHIILTALALLSVSSFTIGQINFIENKGQWDDRVEFQTAMNGAVVYLEEDRITYNLYEEVLMDYMHPVGKQLPHRDSFWFHAYEVKFLNCNDAIPSGEKKLEEYHNYYLDKNPNKWATEVKLFDKVRYGELYDGVDMIMYQGGNSLKYDFIVKPHADPSNISLEVNGAYDVSLKDGKIYISTEVNEMIESEPYTYQFIDNKIVSIESKYKLVDNVISFELGKYDPNYKLIIDPELILATNTGSITSNFGFTATYDQDESLVAGGNVFALGFPTTLGAIQSSFNGGYSDAFISKFNEDGSQLIFSTYLGGADNERPHSLITTLDNDIYVMGTTGSANFPTTAGSYDNTFNGGPSHVFSTSQGHHPDGCDIFVAKLGATGGMQACTYVGGTGNDGLNSSGFLEYNYADVFRGEIIVEDDEQVYVATSTSSNDFPVSGLSAQQTYGGGATDGCVFKLNANLNVLQWSSYFGGSADDSGYSLQPDSEGNLFMVGGSRSGNLPTTPDAFRPNSNGGTDGYVVKLNNTGSDILECTYLGTSSYDQTYFVQLDPDDFVYVVGQTEGNYPIQGGVYSNANSGQFIHKLTNDLTISEWSTTVGTGSGEIDISPTAFLVSDCNKIFLTGWGGQTNTFSQASNSTTFGLPITPDAFQSTTDGSDFYLIVLEEEASGLLYATFFGGGISNEHVDGGTSKFSKDGVVYQAVCSGCGSNSDFPTTSGAWSSTNNTSNCDLGVFKFNLGRAEVEIGLDGPDVVCLEEPIQLSNASDPELNIEWDFGNNESSSAQNPIIDYDVPGFYTISLVGTDETGCLDGNVDQITVEVVGDVSPVINAPSSICGGEEAIVEGVGSENVEWEPNPVLNNTSDLVQTITPANTVTLELTDSNMCSEQTVSATIEVNELELSVNYPDEICIGDEVTIVADGGSSYEWMDANQSVVSNSFDLTVSPAETVTYTVSSSTDQGCEGEETITIEVIPGPPGNEDYGPLFVCEGDTIAITANPGDSWDWNPGGFSTQTIEVHPLNSQTYTVFITNVCGSGTDEVTVNVGAAEASIMEPDSICFGEEVTLIAGGGVSYEWINLNDFSTLPGNVVSPQVNTNYQVIVTDENGCTDSETTSISVLPLPDVDAGPNVDVMFLDSAILIGSSSEDFFWWTYSPDLSCTDCLEPTVYPSENTWYFLHAVDEYGCQNYDGVLVQVTGPLFVPNSFTPDGDGLNDVFMANGLIINDYNLQIFNRWGELIFETNDASEGWDGTYKGHEPIIDTYTWRITYDDYRYGRSIKVGHVTIVE